MPCACKRVLERLKFVYTPWSYKDNNGRLNVAEYIDSHDGRQYILQMYMYIRITLLDLENLI